jgi:hypothetical protein
LVFWSVDILFVALIAARRLPLAAAIRSGLGISFGSTSGWTTGVGSSSASSSDCASTTGVSSTASAFFFERLPDPLPRFPLILAGERPDSFPGELSSIAGMSSGSGLPMPESFGAEP